MSVDGWRIQSTHAELLRLDGEQGYRNQVCTQAMWDSRGQIPLTEPPLQ